MQITEEQKLLIEDRLDKNANHMKENDTFSKLKEEHYILYEKVEELLQEEDKELLDELNSKSALMNWEENYLSYIIGLSDGIKLRNILDKIV